jgi:hypothetical protein
MMRFYILLSLLFLWSCNQNKQSTEASPAPPVPEEQSSLVVAEVEDREPLVDMVNVEFQSGKSQYTDWIQDRDAKYYLVDGGYGSDLTFSIKGGHPAIQLIVINTEDEMVYRQNLNGDELVWKGHYDQSGRFTFIVQLDSKLEDKNQIRTQFDLAIEKTGF